MICTQTLQLVFDVGAAVQTLHRILKPGGVALVTIPGITQMSGDEWGTTMQFPAVAVPANEEHRVPTFELEVTDGTGAVVRQAAQLAHPFRIYGATSLPCDR